MTMSEYTEDKLVEQPALQLLADLGWETYDAWHELDHSGGSPLGRETKAEVLLSSRLRPALKKINAELPPLALEEAILELVRDRSRLSLAEANRQIYDLIKNGVRVKIPDPEGGGDTVETVRVIDLNHPDRNDLTCPHNRVHSLC